MVANKSAAISTTFNLKCWLLTLALSKMRFVSFVCMRFGQNATLKSAMFIPFEHMILSELLKFGFRFEEIADRERAISNASPKLQSRSSLKSFVLE